jgi:nucleotide-binding universal stress UspA family protein
MTARPKKVLVCYSGSEAARRALDAAVAQMGYGSLFAVATVAEGDERKANVVLSEARENLLERHLTATYLPLLGDPADELVDTAAAVDADLVVVVQRAGNGKPTSELGSVGAEIVRRVPCDVLVVK